MHHVIGRCPICKDELVVTRLECNTCGASLAGRFSLGPWHRLDAEQLLLLQSFLRNQGKITWVAEELGQSYPTVRARLNDILLTLGLVPRSAPPEETRQRTTAQRQAILTELAEGLISPDEAAKRLQKIDG